MALGLAGYFPNKKITGTIVAVTGRFICHFISGMVFFGSFAPDGMSPAVYSLMINGPFMAVEGGICIAIMAVLPMKQLSRIIKSA